jgi:hypothetical protein
VRKPLLNRTWSTGEPIRPQRSASCSSGRSRPDQAARHRGTPALQRDQLAMAAAPINQSA